MAKVVLVHGGGVGKAFIAEGVKMRFKAHSSSAEVLFSNGDDVELLNALDKSVCDYAIVVAESKHLPLPVLPWQTVQVSGGRL